MLSAPPPLLGRPASVAALFRPELDPPTVVPMWMLPRVERVLLYCGENAFPGVHLTTGGGSGEEGEGGDDVPGEVAPRDRPAGRTRQL